MEPFCLQGRILSGEDLALIRSLIADHPDWNRTAISRHLCELWDWRNGAGRPKDMAARTLLLKLHRRGLIELPSPQRRTARPRARPPEDLQPELLPATVAPIDCLLSPLQPLRLDLAQDLPTRRHLAGLLAKYHYRGFNGAVGENVQYLARDRDGRDLAVMIFGAAAWKVDARDQFIGWSAAQRQERLGGIANQQRFLILPWVRVPHLASHLLSLAIRRLSADWQARYGHPIWLVETFVDVERFDGTAYKAAGWLHLGLTTGRTRQDRDNTLRTSLKSIWVRALHPAFRQRLTSP